MIDRNVIKKRKPFHRSACRAKVEKGYIYLVQGEFEGKAFVKIGRAVKPYKRLITLMDKKTVNQGFKERWHWHGKEFLLEGKSPEKAKLVGVMYSDDHKYLEFAIHRIMSWYAVEDSTKRDKKSEWFTGKVAKEAMRLMSQLGAKQVATTCTMRAVSWLPDYGSGLPDAPVPERFLS